MSNINQNKYSDTENRFLSDYKPLITNEGLLNFNFGKDFESWFNDRFALRKELIDLNYKYKIAINNKIETDKIYYYKDSNVVFTKYHATSLKQLSNKDIKDAVQAFDNLNRFCENHKIKLYVLIVPYNQYLYQQYTKDFANPMGLAVLNSDIKKIQDSSNANIIYAFDELKNASKKDFVAFKTDHHWSEYGAFIGYQLLMEKIKKDFPDVKFLKESDFNTFRSKNVRSDYNREFFQGGTIKYMAPFLNSYITKILDTEYKYYEHKNQNKLKTKIIDISKYRGKEYYYPEGSNYRLLEIGTSMNENLLQFTPYSFKNTTYIRLNNVKDRKTSEEFKIMKFYKNKILAFKPDIIIFCITTMNINSLKDIFKEDF